MKKALALVLVLLLCVCSMAFASERTGATPSKQQEDMTETVVLNEGAEGFYVRLDESEELLVYSNLETEKLAQAKSVKDYFNIPNDFSKEKDPDRLGITDILGEGEYVVNEVYPLVAGGYKDEFGDIGALMLFPTPYAVDVPVATMIGFVHVTRDEMVGNQRILEQYVEWYAYAGIGVDTSNLQALRDTYASAGTTFSVFDFRRQVAQTEEERKQEAERLDTQIGGIMTVLDGSCIKRIESEIAVCAIVQRAEDVIPAE